MTNQRTSVKKIFLPNRKSTRKLMSSPYGSSSSSQAGPISFRNVDQALAGMKVEKKNAGAQRAGTVAELYASRGYYPYKLYGYNVGCGNSKEDLVIIGLCYTFLWGGIIALYTLLLKFATETDDTDTALWCLLALFVIFIVLLILSIVTGGLEKAKRIKESDHEEEEEE